MKTIILFMTLLTNTYIMAQCPATVNIGNDTTLLCGVTSFVLDAGNIGGTYLWSTTETTQSITVNGTGTYIVGVVDDSSCTGSDTIDVVFDDEPVTAEVERSGSAHIARAFNTDGIEVYSNLSWQWYECNSFGELDTFMYANGTTPSISVCDSLCTVVITIGSCRDTAACYDPVPIGILERDLNSIQAYPNPTTGAFSIDIGSYESLQIVDVLGQEVSAQYTNEGGKVNIEIDVPKGLYFVLIQAKGNLTTIKLINE